MRDSSEEAAQGEDREQEALVTAADWIRRLALIPHPEGGYPGDQVSALPRIGSDEIRHFYAGAALRLSIIDAAGDLVESRRRRRGPFQAVVPALSWFGAEVEDPAGYALVGCTVAPGFDFADFELADRARLLRAHPRHRAVIERLTR
jgi:predicted cupin superfamily sugar epimerase